MTDFPPLPELRWFSKDRAYGYTEADMRAFREECCAYAASNTAAMQSRLAALEAECARLRAWLDNNTTFYDVDADWPVEGPNIPVLASVSNRIWYHATDNQTAYPFSAVLDEALRHKEAK